MSRRSGSAHADQLTNRVVEAFAAAADPAKAPAMVAYMRDQFPFLGIAAPRREQLLREAVTGLPPADEATVVAFCRAMWARPEREFQYAGQWLAHRRARHLSPAFLPVAAELISTRSWWDTVDELAQQVVGIIVLRNRELSDEMDRWVESDDLWIARSAILHQNRWKGDTDAARLFRYCLLRAGDDDFFIRKAIGWALREYSKTDERAVRDFVASHERELSKLSRTEALKWLDRRAARETA